LQFGKASETLGGVGFNVKSSRPNLGDDNLTSTAFIGYFKTKLGNATWKAEAVYGQNMTDVLQIGGFGTNVNNDFVNNKTLSMWTEIQGDFSDSMEWGLFGGYTENGGFGESITYVNGFLGNVENAYRIAPRIGWKSGALTIGIEGEYTNAQYGSIDGNGDIVSSSDSVNNFRLLTTAIYKF
jgi:hypothetical protein